MQNPAHIWEAELRVQASLCATEKRRVWNTQARLSEVGYGKVKKERKQIKGEKNVWIRKDNKNTQDMNSEEQEMRVDPSKDEESWINVYELLKAAMINCHAPDG